MDENSIKSTRINAVDKRIINGRTDVNQLVPFKYKWAWDKYLASCANHWMPQEVNMQRDIELWKSPNGLTDDERLIVTRNLGFFTTADSLAANNIVLGTYRQITAPECRQFLLRQAFEEGIHCYIEGTEVLTESGFKDFRNVGKNEKVAQYHKNGAVDFVLPDEHFSDDFSGDMVAFKNNAKTHDLIVTPQHRCIAIDPRNNNNLKVVLANEFKPKNYKIPVSGKLLNKCHPFSEEDALRVAFQANGHVINKGEVCGNLMIKFQFKRQDKINRLYEICKKLNLKNKTTLIKSGKNEGQSVIYVWVKNDFIFDKSFSWIEISKINHEWIESFMNELALWDGSRRKTGAICYTNTNKESVDKVILLAHMNDMRAGVYKVKKTQSRVDAWQIHIFKRNFVSGKTINVENISYTGKVYCVGVPTGMLVVRYNGIISISGNTHAYQYIVESLGMDEGEVFNAYHEIQSIKAKDEFLIPYIDVLTDPLFKTGTLENDQKLLKSLIVFACIMEGIFFYVGFVQILALGRQNKMTGAAEQYQYILRDESMHCNFGMDLINTIKLENPELWTEELKAELIEIFHKGVELEYAYAEDTMPRGVLGLNASMFKEYLRFICNRRTTQIGLPELFPNQTNNPFPWMSEMIDLKKEKNFFETRVTEYQSGGALDWD